MKMSRTDLADQLAHKLTEAVTTNYIEDFFYNHHEEYYRKTAKDLDLRDVAVALGIIDETDTLEITD